MHEYMELVFLGTGAAWPSVQRNVSATAVKRGSDVLLFDCGEGTQRQFQRSNLSHMALSCMFLTHLHGDHVLGIPGLLQTLKFLERKEPLDIYGPPGTERLVSTWLNPPFPRVSFHVRVHELQDGDHVRGDGFTVVARQVAHTRDVVALGYALVEDPRPGRFDRDKATALGVRPGRDFGRLQRGETVQASDGTEVEPHQVLGPSRRGRKLAFSGDTAPCEAMVSLAQGADVLVHEATFDDERSEDAASMGHCTARQAAFIAAKAEIGHLYLTHFSPRYPDAAGHQAQAQEVHPATTAAHDLDTFTVRFPDDAPVTPDLWVVDSAIPPVARTAMF